MPVPAIGKMVVRSVALATLIGAVAWMAASLRPCGADEAPAGADPKQVDAEQILAKEVAVPDGVVYKKTTDEANRKAVEKLSKAFLSENADVLPDDLLQKAMICGTGLWRNIKDDDEMKKVSGATATIRVHTDKGKEELEGRVFLTQEELAAFWRAYRRNYNFDPQAKIRRPTPEELALYWAMIPFDITEPIFMIESANAVLLAHFTDKELKIAWIDDFNHMHLTLPKQADK